MVARPHQAAYQRFTQLLQHHEALPEGAPLGPGSYEHCLTLHRLARCLKSGGQPAAAEQRLREALAVIEALIAQQPDNQSNTRQRGALLTDLGNVLSAQGKYAAAKDMYEGALEVDRELGDVRGQGVDLAQLGMLALRQKQYDEARQRYRDALALFRTMNEPASEAVLWHQLGRVAQEQQQWAEAERCYRESLALEEQQGNTAGAATTCNQLAIVAQLAGRPAEAEQWYKRAINLSSGMGDQVELARNLNNLANLIKDEVRAGRAPATRLSEARQHAARALEIRETLDASSGIWKTLGILAEIAEMEGRMAAVAAYRRRERESYAAFAGNRYHIDQQHGQLIAAIAAAAQGNEEARQAVEQALPRLEELNWQIAEATGRIWEGERDWHALSEGIDRNSALLVKRVLEVLAGEALSPQPPLPTSGEGELDPAREVVARFEPLLQGVAAVARGEAGLRAQIEEVLPQLEEKGWRVASPFRRIWQGERDAEALTEGLDAQDSALVRRVLAILQGEALSPQPPLPTSGEGEPEAEGARGFTPQQLLAALPPAIREALANEDVAAFLQALEALPEQEQAQVLAIFMALQRMQGGDAGD